MSSEELNLRDARREFEHAIELNPNYATAHHWFGITVLAPLGEHDHAIAELKRAVELDPFSAVINTELGLSYILARRYSEAIAQLRKTVELDPAFPYAHTMLGEALVLSGQLDQAIGEHEKSYNISPRASPLLSMAHAYALKGDRKKALQLFNQAKELGKPMVWAFGCALVSIGLGDKEEAINWLEQSYRQKESVDILLIKVHPFLDPLRGDPRFEKLADKVIEPRQNTRP
ncbi:MAG: tetratricopeptide repeat protein [Chthoniobacterales bacterium]|nr:tetratricopeptide repeat protein [Chthoniobacterales bacterium]